MKVNMIKNTLIILCYSFFISVVGICNAETMPISENLTTGKKIHLTVAGVFSDKKFSSPEETWEHFKNALINGDYESAKDCNSTSNKKKINIFKKIGHSKTQKLIRQIKSIEKVRQEKDSAKYKIVKDMHGVEMITYVYFAKINNEWKIEKF